MDVMSFQLFHFKKIRPCLLSGLVFSFLLFSCKENKKKEQHISIQREGNKAKVVSIPKDLLKGVPADSIQHLLQVQLENTGVDMLGEYSQTNDGIIFRPLIAFTPGLKYDVYLAGKLIGSISIPSNNGNDPPEITFIYPTRNDLPHNLLKMYIAFSKPMEEGQAMKNILMVMNEKDTVPVFLDLQQELWNRERTVLTLWLDPGRIKRGLQPHEKMGIPLEQGQYYQLLINSNWRDTEGLSLEAIYIKNFLVSTWDSISPAIDRWEIFLPKAGTRKALKIELHESLDYLLLKNAVNIVDNSGKRVVGTIETDANETIIVFTPAAAWTAGNYALEVEGRLEDLAGNNLNRLFDQDIGKKKATEQKPIHKRSFSIQ